MASSSALRSGIKNYERYLNVLSGTEPYVAPPLSDYDLLATEILTGSQGSFTFSSLGTYSSDYQHLQIRYVARASTTGTASRGVSLRVNGDSGSNYSSHRLLVEGTTFYPNAYTNQTSMFNIANCTAASSTANAFGAGVIDILDAFDTSKYPTARAFSGMTDTARVAIGSGSWRNTASITSLELLVDNDFVTGSRFSLYGLRSA